MRFSESISLEPIAEQARPRNVLTRLAAYALATFAVVAPQILGGATPETELAILTLAFVVSLGASLAMTRTRRDLGTIPLASIGMAIAVAWTLVQLVPMPCAMIGRAFPERMEILQELVKLHALEAPRCAITGAPGSTRASLALAAMLLQLALSAVALSRAGHRRVLLEGVALSSITMAMVAVAHLVMNAENVFGLYAPRESHPQLLAPLMNPNHLAGFLALGFPLCLSFALSHQRLDTRIAWLSGAFVVLVCSMFTQSRGGVGAIVLGGGSYVLLHMVRSYRRRGELSAKAFFGIGAVVVAGGGGLFLGAELVAEAFRGEGASLDKLTSSAPLIELVRRQPWFGVGRGALGDASPEILAGNVRVLYAENLPIQWLVEWGVPASAAIFAFLVASVLRVRPPLRQEIAMGCGLLALLAQNLVDYNLEIAGVASVAALGFGALISRESTTSWLARCRLRTVQPIAVAVAGLSVLFAAPVLTGRARPNIQARLENQLEANPTAFDLDLSTALLDYPLDPLLIVYGSARAVRSHVGSATKWLNLAMRVAPQWSAPHLQAAHYFEKIGRLGQAAVELGMVAELDPFHWEHPACDFMSRHPRAELAMAVIALGSFREASSDRIFYCFNLAVSEVERFAQLLLAEDPNGIPANVMLARVAAHRKDEAATRTHMERALQVRPADAQLWAVYLDLLQQLGLGREALDKAGKLPTDVRASRQVLSTLAAIAAATPDLAILESSTTELIQRYGTSVSLRAQLEAHASTLFTQAGEPLRALASAKSAFEALGTPELAELTYSAALRANMPGVALRMAAELCHVAHRNGRYCSKPVLPTP